MGDVTPNEQLPYLCPEDLMTRQSIQDLAEKADLSANRVAQDVAQIVTPPRGRLFIDGGTFDASSNTTLTFDFRFTDIDTAYERDIRYHDAFGGTFDGFLVNVPGVYYTSLVIHAEIPDSDFLDLMTLQIRYGTPGASASTEFGRSWGSHTLGQNSGDFVAGQLRVSGLVVASSVLEPIHTRARAVRAAGAQTYTYSGELKTRLFARCGPVLNANASFENGSTQPWTPTLATVAPSDVEAFDGNYSMLISPSGDGWTVDSEIIPWPYPAGTVTLWQGWFRAEGATNSEQRMVMRFLDGAQQEISTVQSQLVTADNTGFATRSVLFSAPVGTEFLQMVITHESGTPVAGVYADRLMVMAALCRQAP